MHHKMETCSCSAKVKQKCDLKELWLCCSFVKNKYEWIRQHHCNKTSQAIHAKQKKIFARYNTVKTLLANFQQPQKSYHSPRFSQRLVNLLTQGLHGLRSILLSQCSTNLIFRGLCHSRRVWIINSHLRVHATDMLPQCSTSYLHISFFSQQIWVRWLQ